MNFTQALLLAKFALSVMEVIKRENRDPTPEEVTQLRVESGLTEDEWKALAPKQ